MNSGLNLSSKTQVVEILMRNFGVRVENNIMTWVGLNQPFLFIYVGQNTTITVKIIIFH